MTSAQQFTSADPTISEPATARPDGCTCCGGTREPDPTDFFIGMLKEVSRHSVELSSLVVEEARHAVETAAPAPADAETPAPAITPRNPWYPAAALAHSRLTRSLRLCMALAVKFHEDRLLREAGIVREQKAAQQARKNRLKKQLDNLVSDAIDRQFEREKNRMIESEDEFYDEDVETDKELRVHEALAERLENEDIEQGLGEISQGELLMRICRDLGVEPEPERWRTMHWALEEARRKVPGSPFAEAEDVADPADPPSG
jgi:hypothetical protein